MSTLDADLIAARAEADQGHQLCSDFLDHLITEYRQFCPERDPQDRRSVWMNESRAEISHEEAIALLTIAIDKMAREEI
jgi:hypothetical protein